MAAPAYLFGNRPLAPTEADFDAALAAAHAEHHRPRCLCRVEGVEMYVARMGAGFIVKRMPYTGCHHAPDCLSYEPPPEWSGLGKVLRAAIKENLATGLTSLRLGFAMSKTGWQPADAESVERGGRVDDDVSKLTLHGLLDYLWDQAELTHWRPAFTGRRSWGTVRRHLLQAADGKIVRGRALKDSLYIPEVFNVGQRCEINERRLAQWTHATRSGRGSHPLMLLIGELKEMFPGRYGYRAILKHVPDQPFALDEHLHRRTCKRFERELALWGMSDSVHMVMIATCGLNSAGIPVIEETSLMPVTDQWIPVQDSPEQLLVERLVRESRTFVKCLRYNLPAGRLLSRAVLTDTDPSPIVLCIAPWDANLPLWENELTHSRHIDSSTPWVWQIDQVAMPALPQKKR